MTEQNPYQQLGVTEDASFEEIQEAKTRLMKEYENDQQQKEAVEAAYDAVIMDRLRLRQEGKIKVPERIRFPEKAKPAQPKPNPISQGNSPDWLQRLLDTPSRNDLLIAAGVFVVLGGMSISSVQLATTALSLGFPGTVFLLYRKEKRFARAALISVVTLVVGVAIGSVIGPIVAEGMNDTQFTVLASLFFLWLTTSFLR